MTWLIAVGVTLFWTMLEPAAEAATPSKLPGSWYAAGYFVSRLSGPNLRPVNVPGTEIVYENLSFDANTRAFSTVEANYFGTWNQKAAKVTLSSGGIKESVADSIIQGLASGFATHPRISLLTASPDGLALIAKITPQGHGLTGTLTSRFRGVLFDGFRELPFRVLIDYKFYAVPLQPPPTLLSPFEEAAPQRLTPPLGHDRTDAVAKHAWQSAARWLQQLP